MGGPMYDAIMNRAGDVRFVQEYLSSRIDRDVFQKNVRSAAEELTGRGLDSWQADLLRRMPIDEKAAVGQLLQALAADDIIDAPVADDAGYAEFQTRILQDFSHLTDRYTSIFPEETRVAYELSMALRPLNIVVAGSYYAYLAVWMIPGLGDGGTMVCVDPDERVSALAERNMKALGFDDQVRVLAEDAVQVLAEGDGPIDLLVVDAYGPSTNTNPEHRGKAIYGPIVRAALPRMKTGGVVMAHNADRESPSLDGFLDALNDARWKVFLDTTEHLAVFGL
jgi:predicted O-methyltransferase YrrM